MMELVDMPGRSIIVSVSRLWTFHLECVGGGLRGPFFDPKLGVPKIWVGEHFCMRGDPVKKKTHLMWCKYFMET